MAGRIVLQLCKAITKIKTENIMEEENTLMQQPEMNSGEDLMLLNDLAIDDAATAMNIEADAGTQIKTYCREIMRGEVSASAVKMLLAGLRHDDDVKNAEGEGYIRGRNEKIELQQRFEQYSEEYARANSVMPRFARRSIWDIEE